MYTNPTAILQRATLLHSAANSVFGVVSWSIRRSISTNNAAQEATSAWPTVLENGFGCI
jgi:hypothetical protein